MFNFLIIAQVDSMPTDSSSELSYGWLLFRTIIAMAIVLAMAVLFIKYILPKLNQSKWSRESSYITIVEKVPIDAKKSLYIAEVGNEKILLGATDHQINFISKVKEEK
jgi:flagellar protein FliO/FliZ